MGMHTHLSILKEYGEVKSLYVNNYGWINTRLYQEILLNDTLDYIRLDEIHEKVWEGDFKLDTLYLSENSPGDGSIEIHDLIKLLKRYKELYKKDEEDSWLKKNWTNLILKLESLVASKIVTENETIEFKYW